VKQGKNTILSTNYFFSIALILLLLLAPCKVRNSLQTVLNIPLTNVLNKNISSIKETSCSLQEGNAIEIAKQTNKESKGVFTIPRLIITTFHINTRPKFNLPTDIISSFIKKPPFYLLYKTFKLYH